MAGILTSALSAQTIGGIWERLDTAGGPGVPNEFGHAVAFVDDLNQDGVDDILVGAPLGVGLVRVLSGADRSLLFEIPAPTVGIGHGLAVTQIDDLNGDGQKEFGIASRGEVSIFTKDGVLIHTIFPPTSDNSFGQSLHSPGDLNFDGIPDIVIGAPTISLSGKVFVYSGFDFSRIQTWPGSSQGWFGTSLASVPDVDGDSIPEVLIGDPTAVISNGNSLGEVQMLSGATGLLIHEWESNGSGAFGNFGVSVACVDDLDGDGFPDVLIGDSVRNRVSLMSSNTGNEIATIHPSWSGGFGSSVANAGDIDGDGVEDFAVGSPNHNGGTRNGRVDFFSGATGSTIYYYLAKSAEYTLGSALAYSLNGPHGDPVVVSGSPEASPANSGVGSGTITVFGRKGFLSVTSDSISASNAQAIDFTLAFKNTEANKNYRVLASLSGTGPSFYGVDIPLSNDTAAMRTWSGIYAPGTPVNMHGTLDNKGNATASVSFAPNALQSIVGQNIYFAAVSLSNTDVPEASSVALTVLVTP
ncbi:MAG: FG-GAP repeat protein [Planctomycetes bacterium]|nr:FG-GAP repeat protein [Planctomycetota bacterium]